MKKMAILALVFVAIVFASCGVKTDEPPPTSTMPTTVIEATSEPGVDTSTETLPLENSANESLQSTAPLSAGTTKGVSQASQAGTTNNKTNAVQPTSQNPGTSVSVTYNTISGDWPEYKNAAEVVEKADLVFEGKVTGISFQVLDMRTSLPPTKDTEEWNRSLYTIYDVEIATVYKGNQQRTIQVKLDGGIRGVRVDDQLRALGADASKGIPVAEGMLVLAIGRTYLFVVKKNGTLPAFILNTTQSVYDLANPSAKQSNISANDVIAVFE